jgi:hypothetical protein
VQHTEELIASTARELDGWVRGNYSQVLCVNPGETKVRTVCELKVSLSNAKPLVVSASDPSGASAGPFAWTGSATSEAGLAVTECSGSVAHPLLDEHLPRIRRRVAVCGALDVGVTVDPVGPAVPGEAVGEVVDPAAWRREGANVFVVAGLV